jgi:hypothetical protein
MELTYLADRVRQDHALICGELAILKEAENESGACSWQILQDVCSRLSLALLEHMRREDRMTTQPSKGHFSDYRYLQVITRHISSNNDPHLLNNRFKLLTGFLEGLHRHMDEQERDFFPVLEPAMAQEFSIIT